MLARWMVLCYVGLMGIHTIADAKENRKHWLEARVDYLTSSDFYTWLGNTPKWWTDTRAGILCGKRTGEQKQFPPEVAVSVEHGSFDEEHIITKFAEEVGAICEPTNTLTMNDRWPGLAASIDGLVVGIDTGEATLRFAQDKRAMETLAYDLQYALEEEGTPVVLEIKKSTSAGWSDGKVSEWYVPQIQGQMHILDLNYAVIVADTILRKGPRFFWNLTATLVARDPAFATEMDRMNEEFLTAVKRGAK